MSWAIPHDVTSRWVGSGTPTDTDLISQLIDDAEAVILSEFPLIQGRIDTGTLPLQTVVLVVTRMVIRVLRNPEGLSYVQQMTGPFSQAKNYSGAGSDIWLTSEELKMLSPKRKGKAFEVDLAPYAVPGYEIGYSPSETTFSATYFVNSEDD